MAAPNYPDNSMSGGRSSEIFTGESTMQHGMPMEDGSSQSRKDEVRHKADDLAHKAGETAKEQIDRQKEQAVGRLSHVSGALRSTSDHLRHEDESSIARYVDEVATQVDRFVGYLDEKSAGDLLRDTRQLARRDPALFLGGAALLGLIGARFVRSSERNGGRQMADRRAPARERDADELKSWRGDESYRI